MVNASRTHCNPQPNATGSRSRRSEIVHFTHHVCMQLGVCKRGEAYANRFLSEQNPYGESPLYRHGRNPDLIAGICCPGKKRRASMNPTEVTCQRCRDAMAKDTREAWAARARHAAECDPVTVRDSNVRLYSNWVGDHQLTIEAWLTCCKDFGAPWPFSERERVDSERWYRAVSMRKTMDVASLVLIGVNKKRPDSVAGDLAARIAKLDPADRTLIHPVLADARRLDELLAEAQRLLTSIEARVTSAATHIRSRALVALPRLSHTSD
jgi:hypothetical protein